MTKKPEYIEELVFKLNTGQISQEEYNTLLNWYNSHNDEEVEILLKKADSAEGLKWRMLSRLLTRVSAEQARRPSRRARYAWMAAAAAIVIALGIWAAVKLTKPANEQRAMESIEPGGNKATLTLADGRSVELSAGQSGIIAAGGITYTDGRPVAELSAGALGAEPQMMTLQTPRGGTYRIVLPDSTEVWLNAQSRLKYPSSFSAGDRVVELEGEAYFHVKPLYRRSGRVPFRVLSKRQTVEVLGTRFNLSAYADQPAGKTTLVEGRVAIGDGRGRFTLKPGDQALTAESGTRVRQVDVADYTAWVEGKFSFDNKTFEETMAELGRWYNLSIVYEDQIPQEELVGDAYRNQNISLVLRLLDVAEIDYQLDAARRRLIIKGKKNRL